MDRQPPPLFGPQNPPQSTGSQSSNSNPNPSFTPPNPSAPDGQANRTPSGSAGFGSGPFGSGPFGSGLGGGQQLWGMPGSSGPHAANPSTTSGPLSTSLFGTSLGSGYVSPSTATGATTISRLPSELHVRRYGEDETRVVETDIPAAFQDCAVSYAPQSFEEWRLEQMPGFQSATVKRNNPLSTLSGDEMVEVIVDKFAKCWFIHRKLLCSASSFFETALNSAFREGVEKKVILEEDENIIFALFVQWLYSGSFTCRSIDMLLRAYVLGDKLGCKDFQNLAFDKVHALNSHLCYFNPQQAIWVSEKTLQNSALRRFTMDTMAFGLLQGTLILSDDDWELLAPISLEILQSVQAVAKIQQRSRSSWRHRPRLDYYLPSK